MKRVDRLYILLLFFCCLTVVNVLGQEDVKQPLAFNDFFHEKMEKIVGILPVYQDSTSVYLEIPDRLLGREIEIRAQINKGFDMVARPLESLGVVYLEKVKNGSIYLQRRNFSERVSGKKDELYEAFRKSNLQPVDIVYPIKAYASGNSGYIIDITEMLKTRDEWFKVSFSKMRGQESSLAKILGVHSFVDGVSFAVHRMYGFSPEQAQAGMISPGGFLSVEIGCVVTLLPEQEMKERWADERIKYQAISFWDYSQNPYCAERDSIIRRWNLGISKRDKEAYQRGKWVNPLNPIVFYIDTCCPVEWIPRIKEAVLAWNTAFEKAGFKNVMQVRIADTRTVLVEQRAVIAYDLDEIGIKTTCTFHPKTGEILSCRINIGHGFLPGELQRYLLQCGTVDGRIRANRFHPEVAGEILRARVMKAVGQALGLGDNLIGSTAFTIEQVKDAAWLKKYGYTGSIMDENPYHYAIRKTDRVPLKELVPRIGIYDCLAIEWGYREFLSCKDRYEAWEILRKKYKDFELENLSSKEKDTRVCRGDLSNNPLKALDDGITNLLSLTELMDDIVYPGKKYDWGRAIMALNKAGIDLFGEYLLQVASYIGGKRGNVPISIEEQSEAMKILDKYVFTGEKEIITKTVRENMLWQMRENYVRQMKKVFQYLSSSEVIKRIVDSEQEHVGKVYTTDMYFKDLFSMLFCDFAENSEMSFDRMDMQILCVDVLLEQVTGAQTEDLCNSMVRWKLQELCENLKKLENLHKSQHVRMMCKILISRIEKGIGKI